jgi:hypothetical protein
MDQSIPTGDLEFRVALLERATTTLAAQLDELIKASQAGETPSTGGAPSQPLVIDADAISPFATGFHFREIDASGRSYRWTGRSDFFELRFHLNRKAAWTFEMELMTNSHVDMTLLRAFVDYAEIAVMVKEGGHVCGSVPPSRLAGLVTLTFYLPSRFVPSELDPNSEDHRSLSVVFYRISLKPEAVDFRGQSSGEMAFPTHHGKHADRDI